MHLKVPAARMDALPRVYVLGQHVPQVRDTGMAAGDCAVLPCCFYPDWLGAWVQRVSFLWCSAASTVTVQGSRCVCVAIKRGGVGQATCGGYVNGLTR